MRFSIEPHLSWRGWQHSLQVDEFATRATGRSLLMFKTAEWTAPWRDGRTLHLQFPSLATKPVKVVILLDDAEIARGVLKAPSWPRRPKEVAWTCGDVSLVHDVQICRQSRHSLRPLGGKRLAYWDQRGCKTVGVVRRSAVDDLLAAAVGIALASVMLSE